MQERNEAIAVASKLSTKHLNANVITDYNARYDEREYRDVDWWWVSLW